MKRKDKPLFGECNMTLTVKHVLKNCIKQDYLKIPRDIPKLRVDVKNAQLLKMYQY